MTDKRLDRIKELRESIIGIFGKSMEDKLDELIELEIEVRKENGELVRK